MQDCILGSLRKNFPGIVAIGEEGDEQQGEVKPDWIVTSGDMEALAMDIPDQYKDVKMEDICVWVDPLDGTKEYTEVHLGNSRA